MLETRDEIEIIPIRESGCFVEPPVDQPRGAPEAKKLARANAIRHGYVKNISAPPSWDKGGGFNKICKDVRQRVYIQASATDDCRS